MNALRLVVAGAAGRMGRLLVRTVAESADCRLVGATGRPGSVALGEDAGLLAAAGRLCVPISDDAAALLTEADGILDFTTPANTLALAALAAPRGLVHVVGTTGMSDHDLRELRRLGAQGGRIVQSGNMSLGINLLAGLVRKVAATLGPEFDIEILEMHHRMKVDAPSGTALLLGEAAAAGREVSLDERSVRGRDGHTGARHEGDIGFAALRGGSVVGDHSVIFAGAGERLELGHRGEDRGIYARGAIKAALWAAARPPGYYTMDDVLGLSDV